MRWLFFAIVVPAAVPAFVVLIAGAGGSSANRVIGLWGASALLMAKGSLVVADRLCLRGAGRCVAVLAACTAATAGFCFALGAAGGIAP